jgi:hypothetical protein
MRPASYEQSGDTQFLKIFRSIAAKSAPLQSCRIRDCANSGIQIQQPQDWQKRSLRDRLHGLPCKCQHLQNVPTIEALY